MLFCEPHVLLLGDVCNLTEFVEGIKVSSGEFYLVQKQIKLNQMYPVLGFSKSQNGGVRVFLIEAHTAFAGELMWRRAFKVGGAWEVYWPAGAFTWNRSWVFVEKVK